MKGRQRRSRRAGNRDFNRRDACDIRTDRLHDQVSQFCLENRVVGECTEIGFQIVEKNCRAITSKLIENDCENAIAGTDGDGRVVRVCVVARWFGSNCWRTNHSSLC
jgi:hypothetical protein